MVRTVVNLGVDGCPLKNSDKGLPSLQVEIYRSPRSYENEAATSIQWRYVGQMIRKMSTPVCKGAISQGFFTIDKHVDQTAVVFLLYGVPKEGRRNVYGFALCDDLRQERGSSKEDSLYIDAVCAGILVNSPMSNNGWSSG